MTTVKIKHSATGGNVPASLEVGEIAINEADGILFYRDSGGTVTALKLNPAVYTLTDAATIAVNWAAGINFEVTLTTSRILGNPTNGVPGTWRTVLVTQPAAGTAVLTYGNQYVSPGGVDPVIATGNAAKSRLMLFCRTTSIFEVYGGGIGLS